MEEKISITGNITASSGAVINLGEIKNSAITTIQNLPSQDAEGKATSEVKRHLEDLVNAISLEESLSVNEKEFALQQVNQLSEALQVKDGGQRKRKAGMAFSSLKFLNDSLADVAKLASSMKVLLPSIGAFFGLP